MNAPAALTLGLDAPEHRPGWQRGRFHNDWLQARFSLNFGAWRAPGREAFGPLRVLNDDRVQPRRGFPMHPHRDVDILMIPLTAPIEHRDDRGGHAVVHPGQIQWMRAGSGIAHAQTNACASAVDHHLQLWFEPRRVGGEPAVRQHTLPALRLGQWQPLHGPALDDAAGRGFEPDADVRVSLGWSAPGQPLSLPAGQARLLHAVRGRGHAQRPGGQSHALEAGDEAVWFDTAPALRVGSLSVAVWLVVDTAPVDPVSGRLRTSRPGEWRLAGDR